MFLTKYVQKYTQYKQAQQEQQKKKVTEKELCQLNHKIEKLLTRLDEHEPELAANQDEECVVCVNAKATMQTFPCNHRVLCRVCLVRCIQSAVGQRLLPLRCVICRAKILKLKATNGPIQPIPASASQYTLSGQGFRFPQSASLYSVTSNTSGVSAISSTSSCSSASSYKTCASSVSGLSSASSSLSSSLKKSRLSSYNRMGYQPLKTTPSPTRSPPRTPSTPSSEVSKGFPNLAKRDNKVAPSEPTTPAKPKGKMSLIQEFQKEFRQSLALSKSSSFSSSKDGGLGGGSTRIKCAKHLVSMASSPLSPEPKIPALRTQQIQLTAKGPSNKTRSPSPSAQSYSSLQLSRSSSGNSNNGRQPWPMSISSRNAKLSVPLPNAAFIQKVPPNTEKNTMSTSGSKKAEKGAGKALMTKANSTSTPSLKKSKSNKK